jgi:hypothetical protein
LSVDGCHDITTPDCVELTVRPCGTLGALVSTTEHATVDALTDATPDTFPAPSTAATPNVYDAPHTNPPNKYDVPTTVPTCPPPTNTRYPVTPTSSLDAAHANDNDVCPAALTTRPPGTDGGDTSTHACVEIVPDAYAGSDRLPAASYASRPTL